MSISIRTEYNGFQVWTDPVQQTFEGRCIGSGDSLSAACHEAILELMRDLAVLNRFQKGIGNLSLDHDRNVKIQNLLSAALNED